MENENQYAQHLHQLYREVLVQNTILKGLIFTLIYSNGINPEVFKYAIETMRERVLESDRSTAEKLGAESDFSNILKSFSDWQSFVENILKNQQIKNAAAQTTDETGFPGVIFDDREENNSI